MTKSQNFIKGTVIGAAIGFIAGLLLAPKSGEETQAELKRRAKGLWGDASDRANKMQQQLDAKVERLKAVAQDLGGQAKEDSQSLIARAEAMKQDLRGQAKTLAQAGRQAKEETLTGVRQIMDEGATLMVELEDITKRLLSQAKTKLKADKDEAGQEALARVEELEQKDHLLD